MRNLCLACVVVVSIGMATLPDERIAAEQPNPVPQVVKPSPVPTQEEIRQLVQDLGKSRGRSKKATERLIRIGKPAVPVLIEALEEKKFGIRWGAVNVLGYIKDKRAVPFLVQRVLTDTDNHVRWRSIWALNSIDDDRAVTKLREVLKGQDKRTRWNAAVALSTMNDNEAVPVLLTGLQDQSSWVRWEAVNALGRVHDEKTVTALLPLLADPSARIRQETVLSLGEIGGPKATAALVNALSDKSPGVRWRAAMGLSRLGQKSAVSTIEEAWKRETNQLAKKEFKDALEKLKSER